MSPKARRIQLLKSQGEQLRLDAIHALQDLATHHAACCLKLSTEDAAMGFEQIRYWMELAQGTLPVMVKIGGPNARNDIKRLVDMNVDGLNAPMVESAFGLQNFLEAVADYCTPLQYARLRKSINIETIHATRNLDEILAMESVSDLDEMTLGGTDLSRSMNATVDDPKVQRVLSRVARKLHARGFPFCIGGGIRPGSIEMRLQKLKPAKFNTRVMTFEVHSGRPYDDAVRKALEFEILMLRNDAHLGFISRDEENFRCQALIQRLE